MPKKLTTEEFIQKAKLVHNDKYDYSKVNYTDSKTKVCIICPVHGEFLQVADYHLHENGCAECGLITVINKKSKNNNYFINKSNFKHNFKYNYSKTNYINAKIKVCIICPEHEEFLQSPNNHLQGDGCPKCVGKKFTKNDFIISSNLTHNNLYDYSKVNFINKQLKVCITCKIHGDFNQTPAKHLHGNGCPTCKKSLGEKEIETFLKTNNINFISQKKFDNCKNKHPLPFDFFIPLYNICIEFDGEQHFKSIKYWGGDQTFNKIKRNDNIKNQYCHDNHIKLLRISYKDNIIETLKNYL